MAYIDQTKKASIAKALKGIIPQGWKYSLAIRHHSTLVLTITGAPLDLIALYGVEGRTELNVNRHHYATHCADECLRDTLGAILDALNAGNHDRSDLQTDYFDVGWYVDVRIGAWNRPFAVTAPAVLPEVMA